MQLLNVPPKTTRFSKWRMTALTCLAVIIGSGACASPPPRSREPAARDWDASASDAATSGHRSMSADAAAARGLEPSPLIDIRAWVDAPSRCFEKVGGGDVLRPETAYATVLFLRYLRSRVQGGNAAGSSDELDWLLRDVSAKPSGDKFLVVPVGFGAGWTGGNVTERPVEAMSHAFEGGSGQAYVVQVEVLGAINDGGAAPPMLGVISVRLYYDRPNYIGRFGGSARVCIVPAPGRGPHVFVEPGVEF
jgi:hypothetical protein